MSAFNAQNMHQPMNEKQWDSYYLQKGSGKDSFNNGFTKRLGFKRGTGFGSVFGHLVRTVIPISKAKNVSKNKTNVKVSNAKNPAQVKRKIRKRKKTTPKRIVQQQTGKGIGVRPRKRLQRALGPPKSIKRVVKKKQKPRKIKRKFGLFV